VLDGVQHALIVPHTNPDPDAIASSLALRYLLSHRYGISAAIRYHGIIGRAENRALVHYLRRPLRRLRSAELTAATAIFVMDTQPGAGNCPVPISAAIRGVVDHHPQREDVVSTGFIDVRPTLGATATILTEYLRAAELDLPQWLATALFYGIKTDTSGLIRGAAPADVAAFLYLQPLIDPAALLEIEQAQVPLAYFRQLYAAVRTAQVYQDVVIADLGTMAYPDIAGEVADLLLRLEGMQWSACLGVYDDVLVLSVRTRRKRGGAGRLVEAVVGGDGTAGGHGMAAGGQISLDSSTATTMTQTIIRRILTYLQQSTDAGVPLIP
jgi:nanoRNase/pAp phosphatase (c-di-AMP/oligoRNAs hydrolase)